MEADILIAAAGKPNLVDSSFVKEGAVIIDVGIHRLKSSDKNKTRLCGDVLLEDVIPKAFAYTPCTRWCWTNDSNNVTSKYYF